MVCSHVKKLYKYINENKLEISSSDLVHVACKKCKQKEDCISIK
ncbi:MAG: hypothetical protein ABH828_05515 [archaeon]